MREKIAAKYNIQWEPPIISLPRESSQETTWHLAEEFIVEWEENNKQHKLVIKKGMPTDGASVPRIFWSFGFLPTGTEMGGAMVHDTAYEVQGHLINSKWLKIYEKVDGEWLQATNIVWSRKQSDDYFYRFMLQGGTNPKKAWLMHTMVRLFAGGLWQGRPWWRFI